MILTKDEAVRALLAVRPDIPTPIVDLREHHMVTGSVMLEIWQDFEHHPTPFWLTRAEYDRVLLEGMKLARDRAP